MYSFTETLRSKLLKTEVIISADNTSTVISTPKSYALAGVALVNGEATTDFESKQCIIDSPTTATGFIIDGTCNVDLICRYTGTNTAIAETFNLELIDTNIATATDFVDTISASLAYYYPAITADKIKIKTAVFKFHE